MNAIERKKILNNDYSYLNGLSDEAQKAIINQIDCGKKNIYHSIMAVLDGRRKKGVLKDCESEKKYYLSYSKRKTDLTDIDEYYDEIFTYVYQRYINKPRRYKATQLPLTCKDNMLIAKGAMILALEKCSVSEKNIKGMLGVIDTILQTTSEYELKQTYKEHIRAYKKENDKERKHE